MIAHLLLKNYSRDQGKIYIKYKKYNEISL